MNMNFTGERFVPQLRGQIYYEHFHRYAAALPLVNGKEVLDIACGEGYGTAYLAMAAESVIGVDIDEASVRHAAARAHIAEYIESLPSGYSTMVGEQGVRLSGGQRQRIGLARALYRSASVLVLDEATNALDGETEAAVMESIRCLGRDLTIIIIAHRMATVEICDRCFLIKHGGISEIPLAKGEKAGLEHSLDLRAYPGIFAGSDEK